MGHIFEGLGWRLVRDTFGLLLGAVALAVSATTASAETQPGSLQGSAKRLAGVATWGYQLQAVDPAEIAASPYDLVVIDYSRNGKDARRFTPGEVKLMQAKQDGSRRIVLAYLSIGEAEDYRYYWSRGWVEPAPLRQPLGTEAQPTVPKGLETVRIPKLMAPSWLGRENEHWRGNYHVRFWYDGWQEIIMHDKDSYLSRIISAGFDGVYLDRVDVYYAIERDTDSAKDWMVNFVVELATIARQRKPGFIIVPQNAEELLSEQRYLAAIDGIGKEDLLYGGDGDGVRNSDGRIGLSSRKLALARTAGLAVLAVEYLSDPKQLATAYSELRSRGLIPYFAPRTLDRLAPLYKPGASDEASPKQAEPATGKPR